MKIYFGEPGNPPRLFTRDNYRSPHDLPECDFGNGEVHWADYAYQILVDALGGLEIKRPPEDQKMVELLSMDFAVYLIDRFPDGSQPMNLPQVEVCDWYFDQVALIHETEQLQHESRV